MYWTLAGLAICAVIVIAGRAHSRYLDEHDEEAWLNPMTPPPDFAVVCKSCGSLTVRSDYAEGAPSSTVIKCSACDSPRGTLGGLRVLANRRD
jgi:hypothetical protein